MLYTKPLGKKCVPSSLTRNYVFFNDKCCSATVQRAPSNKHTVKRERMTQKGILSMGTPCEDRLQRRFLEFFSNDDAVSRVRHDYFKTATFHTKQTFLQRSYFPRVTNSTQQLLSWSSSYFFRKLTSSQQLFFENSYLFWAKILRTSNFLWICSYLGQPAFQRTVTI